MGSVAVRERSLAVSWGNPAWPTFSLTLGCHQSQARQWGQTSDRLASHAVLPEWQEKVLTSGSSFRECGKFLGRDSGPQRQ